MEESLAQFVGDRDIVSLDGAKLLDEIFDELSGGAEFYEKLLDGPVLTKRILTSEPSVFQEIADIVSRMLNESGSY